MKTYSLIKKEQEYKDTKTYCDICKKEIIESSKSFEIERTVKIELRHGSIYPEDDCTTYLLIDCCPKCFKEKIVPVLEKEFNINFRDVESYDYYSGKKVYKEITEKEAKFEAERNRGGL